MGKGNSSIENAHAKCVEEGIVCRRSGRVLNIVKTLPCPSYVKYYWTRLNYYKREGENNGDKGQLSRYQSSLLYMKIREGKQIK
jgi:hypothetical protein